MILDHVELSASPFFSRSNCPKCRKDTVEIPNGWFSVCWYCKNCDAVYELKMTKVRTVNRENVAKLLKEKGIVIEPTVATIE